MMSLNLRYEDNHRAACLSPVCAQLGCCQEDDVSLPATKCTCISNNMSLTRLPCKVVDETSCNAPPPHGVEQCSVKGRGPELISAVAVDFSQHGSTLHLPVRRLEAGGRKVSEMFDPLTNATGKCFLSLEHSITVAYEMCNRMKLAALVNKLSDEERR